MSVTENKTLIRQYVDLFNKDWAAALKHYIADESLVQHIHFFQGAFPGYQLTPEDVVAEGDKVVVRTMFRGVHQGALLDIPATGKEVAMSFIIIYRIANNKIVEHWMAVDRMGLMERLGAVPAPEAHAG